MNIADILAPKPPPTIDAARVTTHQLPDDGRDQEENDMSNHSDVQKAVADCGGRATREEIGTATGFEGKELENAIYNAIKKHGLIRRDGQDFVLAKPGSNGTSEAATKPAKAASKPAKPAGKTAKAKPAKPAKKAPKAAPFDVNAPEPILLSATVEANLLTNGGAIVTQRDIVLHRLSAAAVAAILNATRS